MCPIDDSELVANHFLFAFRMDLTTPYPLHLRLVVLGNILHSDRPSRNRWSLRPNRQSKSRAGFDFHPDRFVDRNGLTMDLEANLRRQILGYTGLSFDPMYRTFVSQCVQPFLFGFEGHLDIDAIERHIFGIAMGRLEWSPCSSPLSQHQRNQYGECVGIDPVTDPTIAQLVESAQHASPGEQRIFTIVDTGTMQVTLIQAERPPVAFLLVGEEGGMQRAVGISYEWETATCYRETVIRIPTHISTEKMAKVARLRFGLKRRSLPVKRGVMV